MNIKVKISIFKKLIFLVKHNHISNHPFNVFLLNHNIKLNLKDTNFTPFLIRPNYLNESEKSLNTESSSNFLGDLKFVTYTINDLFLLCRNYGDDSYDTIDGWSLIVDIIYSNDSLKETENVNIKNNVKIYDSNPKPEKITKYKKRKCEEKNIIMKIANV